MAVEIIQETRLFDPSTGATRSMRGKEEAHDYRYFPDPDLVPLVISADWVEDARLALPELPETKRRRYVARTWLDRLRRRGTDGIPRTGTLF